MRYVNSREGEIGVTLMRDGIEGAGPLVPTPGPRQGAPASSSRSDDGSNVRILSVLGGPLARAGPHPVRAVHAGASPASARRSRSPAPAPRGANPGPVLARP